LWQLAPGFRDFHISYEKALFRVIGDFSGALFHSISSNGNPMGAKLRFEGESEVETVGLDMLRMGESRVAEEISWNEGWARVKRGAMVFLVKNT